LNTINNNSIKNKKRILLINPDYELHTRNFYEPIELGIIASITPTDEWDIKIVDLRIDSINDFKADLVAITARVLNINSTYKILENFRKNGAKTIIGGIHATLFPDEALNYADCVVIGEAESVWANILKDFNAQQLKPQYFGSTDLTYKLDRSHYKHYYKTASLQLSRGCPLACDFCCINKIHKQKHFFRNTDLVIEEIKTIKHKTLFFTDENIYGFTKENRNHVINLFKEIIKQRLNKNWIGMVSINAGMDDEFLYYAQKSGCKLLIIGFEADDKESLMILNKTQNAKLIDNYSAIINRIHKHKIAVCGVFIFGLANDTKKSIENRRKYLLNSKLDSYLITLLTPLPGSKLYERNLKNHNLKFTNFPTDWDKYNFYTEHFKDYKIDNIEQIYQKINQDINKPRFLISKIFKTLINTQSISSTLYSNFYLVNHRSEVNNVPFLRLLNKTFENKHRRFYIKQLRK
jgi:radical SAM superfamily enzyme YgiQ (UPF0313 family)